MRLFAVGDIHGCATAFDTLLSAIALRPSDRVITLGDYVNKGPGSKFVLDILLRLFHWDVLIPLLGNHELKMLIAGRFGRAVVYDEVFVDRHTLASYAELPPGLQVSPVDLSHIPDRHWHFLKHQCLRWFTTDKYIFSHGMLSPQVPLLEQPDRVIFWNKLDHPQPHLSGKVLVCGHTPQRSGYPLNLGHTLCLDTAACEGQWLTCLEMTSGNLWQANQQGQLRQSHLQDYGPMPITFPHAAKPMAQGETGLPAGPVPAWPTAATSAHGGVPARPDGAMV